MSVTAPISKCFSKTVKSQHLSKSWMQFDQMRREVCFNIFECHKNDIIYKLNEIIELDEILLKIE